MNRAGCTLSLIVSTLVASTALGQELPFVHYTVDSELNPLPSASVNGILIDSQGFLWFVIHSSGLFRYDGHTSEVYSAEDGLPANSTIDIVEDHKGRVWVLTRHGLAVLEKGLGDYASNERLKFTTTIQGIDLVKVVNANGSNLALAPDGGIWLTVESGAVRYSYDSNGNIQSKTIEFSDGIRSKESAVLPLRDGQIWIVTNQDKIAILDSTGEQMSMVDLKLDASCDGISELRQLISKQAVMACRSGSLFELKPKPKGPIEGIELIKLDSPVQAVSEGKDGSLWLGTNQNGVYYSRSGLKDASFKKLTRKNGLIADSIRRVLEDDEGNIWISQSGGVSKLQQNYKAFQTYTAKSQAGERPVLPSPGVQTVRIGSQPEEGSLWIGTNKGLVVRTGSGLVDVLDHKTSLNDSNIWSQCHDKLGRVWFNASSELGVVTFSGTPVPKGFEVNKKIQLAGKEATLSLKSWEGPRGYSCLTDTLQSPEPQESPRDVVCFSGARTVECWTDDGAWTLLGEENGLVAESNIQSVLLLENGHLLAGTEAQGIFQSTVPLRELLRSKGYERSKRGGADFKAVWGPSTGAPTGDVEYMLVRKGMLWVGTDKGVLKVDPKDMSLQGSITTEQGLPDNFAVSLYESPVTGFIWVGTNAGIAEIDPERMKVVRTVTRTDGLVDNEVWWLQSVFVSEEGAVHYGTPKGLSLYRPSEHSRNTRLPKPVFRYTDLTTSSNGTNEIRIGYSALSYSEEKGVRYKYRILGYNDEWSEPTAEYSQKFMNLPATFVEQDYRFELLASNNDGLWSAEPISWEFSIAPPWWLRWWFWLSMIVFITAVVMAIYRQRTQRLAERARELKEFADALQRAVDNLDEELEERKRVEGKLNEVRMKMFSAEKAAEHAQERRSMALMELKSAKETLIQAEKLSSLGQMVASISHEIANPVWLVGATAQDLSSQIADLESFLGSLFDDSEEAKRVSENINHRMESMRSALENSFTASGRLTDITQALRTQSRFDRAPTTGVILNEVIRESLIIAGGKMKRHTLVKECGDLPLITCYRSHIGQVLTNLFANAADALDESVTQERGRGKIFKGKIVVRSYSEERDGVAGVAVSVSDNGNGVEESIREEVFEAFFTTKPSGVGTGLGLSVCATIVQDHKGYIYVDNDKELGGARFVMWLPLKIAHEDNYAGRDHGENPVDHSVESGSSTVSGSNDGRNE